MQFCKDCGAVLNLFGNNEKELCSACIQHQKQITPTSPPATAPEGPASGDDALELLGETVLSCENNKLILRSKEGWELWSEAAGSRSDLKSILKRAKRIYEIRLRRQKN